MMEEMFSLEILVLLYFISSEFMWTKLWNIESCIVRKQNLAWSSIEEEAPFWGWFITLLG